MSAQYKIDYRSFSVTVIQFEGDPTDEELREFLDEMRREIRQQVERRVLVIDLRKLGKLQPAQRAAVAKYREDVLEEQKRTAIAYAYIMKNPIVRGFLTASLWLKTPPVPLAVFSTPQAARPYIEKHLAKEGLKWPKEVDGFFGKAIEIDTTR